MFPKIKFYNCFFFLLLHNNILALYQDNQKSIHISSNSAEINTKTYQSIYHGNVVIQQGNMTLKGDKVTVTIKQNKIDKIDISSKNNHSYYEMIQNKKENYIRIWCHKISYDTNNGTINFFKNIKVNDNFTSFTCEQLFYNVNTQELKAYSSPGNNNKVKIRINLS